MSFRNSSYQKIINVTAANGSTYFTWVTSDGSQVTETEPAGNLKIMPSAASDYIELRSTTDDSGDKFILYFLDPDFVPNWADKNAALAALIPLLNTLGSGGGAVLTQQISTGWAQDTNGSPVFVETSINTLGAISVRYLDQPAGSVIVPVGSVSPASGGSSTGLTQQIVTNWAQDTQGTYVFVENSIDTAGTITVRYLDGPNGAVVVPVGAVTPISSIDRTFYPYGEELNVAIEFRMFTNRLREYFIARKENGIITYVEGVLVDAADAAIQWAARAGKIYTTKGL